MRDFYLAATCGILPIIVVIVMKSVIYTNNRQMYFCYPALLLISLYGFKFLLEKLKQKTIRWQIWASAVMVLGLAYPVYFMVRYHPYQYVYFNFLAGTKMSDIKGRFTLDSWGISVKQGLDFIAQTDSGNHIRVWVDGPARSYNILPKSYRDRLKITEDSPEYIIWYYHYSSVNKPIPGKKVYSAKVGDTDIMAVFKVKPTAIPSGNLSP